MTAASRSPRGGKEDINWSYFLCSDDEMLASRHAEWVWSSSYGLNSYPLFALPAADTPWPGLPRPL